MAAAATGAGERVGPPRKPGWMSIPGGPREPDRTQLRAKLQGFSSERSKIFDRLKAVANEFEAQRADPAERDGDRSEMAILRNRLKQIDELRRKERTQRHSKDQELRDVRTKRKNIESRLAQLTKELGDFRDVHSIEEAIDHVNIKMETGSGDLKFERIALKRLAMLEEAKSLVQQLEPLAESVQELEEREDELQSEYRQIYERVEQLNKEYEAEAAKKTEKEQTLAKKAPVFDRTKLVRERDELRAQLTALSEQADAATAKFNEDLDAWNKWKVIAQEKYNAQQEAIRAERQKVWDDRQKARKLAMKAAKIAKRKNPFEDHIDACTTLIRYLEDKIVAAKREKEAAEHARKLAAFDPKATAPSGLKLAGRDDEWMFQDRTKKVQKPKTPTPAPAAAAAAAKPDRAPKVGGYVQHTSEKHRLFQLVSVEVPLNLSQAPAAIELLKTKKKEYESHIVDGDVDVSTDEEVEDDGVAASEAPTASEAPAEAAAPAAAAAE